MQNKPSFVIIAVAINMGQGRNRMGKSDTASNNREKDTIEIKEFQFGSSNQQNAKESHKNIGTACKKGVPLKRTLFLVMYGIVFLLAILLGMFVFRVSVVVMGIVLVIEALLAVCLHDEPVWVHGLEMAVCIAAGVLFGEAAIMAAAAFTYFMAILALHEW